MHDIREAAQHALELTEVKRDISRDLVGKENIYVYFKTMYDAASAEAAQPLIEKWRPRLGGVDTFAVNHTFIMYQSLRLDLNREPYVVFFPPTEDDAVGGDGHEGARPPEAGPATMTRDTAEAVRVFTTAGVPAEDRIELWQAHNSAALMSLRCHALTDAQFDGTTVNVRLARTQLCRVRADTAHVIERRSDLIASRPEDSVVLFFVLAGEAFFYHSAGVHIVGSGQMVACDSDRPFMRGFSTDFEELFMKIPRHVFCDIAGVDRLEAPLVTAFTNDQNLFGASLAGLIAAATRADNPTLPDEHALL